MLRRNNIQEVSRFSYRTAMVRNIFMILDRHSEDGKKIERVLLRKAEVDEDNHVVYKVTLSEGGTIYIGAEDSELWIGLSVQEGRW